MSHVREKDAVNAFIYLVYMYIFVIISKRLFFLLLFFITEPQGAYTFFHIYI